MKRILVLRGGALGDFILTIPALRLLRARWPEASIELVGNARAAELGRREGLLQGIHSQHEARWAALYSEAPLPEPLRNWLSSFDLIVCAWPDPDGQIARHIAPLGPCCLFGAAQPACAPAARHFCEILAPLGLATSDFHAALRFPSSSGARSAIAIHPGSGSPKRNWPIDRWVQLCERLLSAKRQPLLIIGGEADHGAISKLTAFGEAAIGLPLTELAQRLATCRCFIGHDTGVTHLAAAVGTPSIVLFGPSDHTLWAPPGKHVHVMHPGTSMEDIGVVEVFAAIENLLGSGNSSKVGNS